MARHNKKWLRAVRKANRARKGEKRPPSPIHSKLHMRLWKNSEYRNKQSVSRKKAWKNSEVRKHHKEGMRRHYQTTSEAQRQRQIQPALIAAHKKTQTKEYRKIQSKRMTDQNNRLWADPKYRKKMSLVRKKMWKDIVFRDVQLTKMMKGCVAAKPNHPERMLDELLNKYFPGEFKCNVKGGIRIGGRVPDFVPIGRSKFLVEMFGDHWHSKRVKGLSKAKEEKQRVAHFKKFGFDTVVIWQKELETPKLVIAKLKEAMV